MTLQWWPSEQHRQRELFEHAYALYQQVIDADGQVPASREVILEEARRNVDYTPLSLLAHKRLRLTP